MEAFICLCTTRNHDQIILFAATAAVGLFIIRATLPWIDPRETGKDCEQLVAQDLSPPRAPVGILEMLRNFAKGNTPWFFEQMAEETGSDIYQLTSKLYVVGNTEAAREILLDKLSQKPPTYGVFVTLFGAHNMFSRQVADEVWHKTRKAVNRAFSTSETKRMNRIALSHVNKWIQETLEPSIANNEPIDPSHEMSRITFKVIVEATMEYMATDEDYESFVHHLELGMKEVIAKNVRNPLRKYYAPLFSQYREAMKSCAEVQAFGQKILDAYRKNPNKSSDNTVIKVLDSPGVCVDEDHRISEISSLIFAGHDTSGYTLGTTLVLLSKHPKVQDKLRAELLSLNVDKRSKSEYMRNVVTESNRLLPVTPLGTVRKIGRDISCKNGSMVIPKGSVMYLPQMLLHRNPSVFKNPKEFLPDRWENTTKEMKDSIMMFSLGQRNCPGQSLGISELHSTIPKLLANYEFELEDEGKLQFSTTLRFTGARLKVSKAL